MARNGNDGNPLRIVDMGGIIGAARRFRNSLYQKPGTTIDGIGPENFPSAGQPVSPIAPRNAEPLGINITYGQNMNYTPRPDAEYTAAELQGLATYDLVRVVIENVKDQLCFTPWEIQRRAVPGETTTERKQKEKGDQNILKLSRFFEYPNNEDDWATWVRPLLDDMLVIDAASVLVRKNFNEEVAELRVVPGDSITRYIDDNGFTPQPPDPAYAQLWEGLPRVNLDTTQLIYRPRNIVRRNTLSSQIYGMSPVEQAATWCRTGALRLKFQESYYTEGSIPGLIHVVPPDATPEKIASTMNQINSEMAGNLWARQQWRMIQGFQTDGKPEQIIFSKEKLLTDPFDDLLIRFICFAFGTSPQRLMKMMNRASAEQTQESADVEGYWPFLMWLKYSVIDYIIQRKFGLTDYEMSFDPRKETDVLKLAQADASDVGAGIVTRAEVRDKRGLDPIDLDEVNQLMVISATAVVPLEGAIERAQASLDQVAAQTAATHASAEATVEEPAPNPAGKPPKGKGVVKYRNLTSNHMVYEVVRAGGS
jgi:hypothetical protein